MIEGKVGTSTTWVAIDVASAKKFSHSGQTLGVRAVWRVRAAEAHPSASRAKRR